MHKDSNAQLEVHATQRSEGCIASCVQGTTVRRDHDSFSIAANYQPYVSCTKRSKDDLSVAVYLSYLDKTVPQVSHSDDILPSKGPL